jgi:hypothetical protein
VHLDAADEKLIREYAEGDGRGRDLRALRAFVCQCRRRLGPAAIFTRVEINPESDGDLLVVWYRSRPPDQREPATEPAGGLESAVEQLANPDLSHIETQTAQPAIVSGRWDSLDGSPRMASETAGEPRGAARFGQMTVGPARSGTAAARSFDIPPAVPRPAATDSDSRSDSPTTPTASRGGSRGGTGAFGAATSS